MLVLLAVLSCLVAFSFRIQISRYFYVVAKSYTSKIYLFSVVAIARITNNDDDYDDNNNDKVVR